MCELTEVKAQMLSCLSGIIVIVYTYKRHVFTYNSYAVFTQRSLSDLTLDRSKFMSDKICLNTLNRIPKSDR